MRMGNEYALERTMGRTESGKCQSKTHKTCRDTLTLLDCSIYYDCWIKYWKQSGIPYTISEQPEQKFYKSIEIERR